MPYLTPNAAPDTMLVRRVRIPASPDWLGIFNGAIAQATLYWNFEQSGDVSPLDTAAAFLRIYEDYLDSDGFMIGQVTPYVTANPPTFCIDCDGGTYNRVDWPELYALLDPAFVIDADTFTTPNLNNGSVPIGAGLSTEGTTFAVGDVGGEENHVLTETENATHNHADLGHIHSYQPPGTTGLAVAPGELPVALPNFIPSATGSASANIQSSGDSAPHNNMSPYVVLKYCVVAR